MSGVPVMHKKSSLATVAVADVCGEHFFVVDCAHRLRAVAERMRDEVCPVAVLTENGKISGVVDGSVIISHVVAQPANWNAAAGTIAAAVPVVGPDSNREMVREHLQKQAVAVVVMNGSGLPIKVITHVSWLRFLNSTVNTAVFKASPHLDVFHSHPYIQPVAS